MRAMKRTGLLGLMAVSWALRLFAGAPAPSPLVQERSEVVFEVRCPQTVPGQSVFVLGDLAELGGDDPVRAVKLEPSDYPVWRLGVELPAGERYSYRYLIRN